MTRYLIVNADDFGATPGVNRGIVEAFHRGIVTSTSLMVTTPASEDAAVLASQTPGLSVGLHVDLQEEAASAGVDRDDLEECAAELQRQLLLFEIMVGCRPTHLDSHHDRHRTPRLLPAFLRVAHEQGLPLRGHSAARCVSSFYGRWHDEAHAEQIAVQSLVRMLDDDVGDGVTELSCHPGHVDAALRSGYAAEREIELRTLCDPALPGALRERGITLIGFRDLGRVASPVAGTGA